MVALVMTEMLESYRLRTTTVSSRTEAIAAIYSDRHSDLVI